MVFENLVKHFLQHSIGRFIEDFDNFKQYFRFKFLSETGIELQRPLRLKCDALNEFFGLDNLALSISHAYIGSLSIHIPLARLDKSPVRVHLSEVFIVVKSKNANTTTKNQQLFSYKEMLTKLQKLSQHEAEHFANTEIEDKESDEFNKKLFRKILDNLQLFVTNFHLRFEDRETNWGSGQSTGTGHSCGLVICGLYLRSSPNSSFLIEQSSLVQCGLPLLYKQFMIKSLCAYVHSPYAKTNNWFDTYNEAPPVYGDSTGSVKTSDAFASFMIQPCLQAGNFSTNLSSQNSGFWLLYPISAFIEVTMKDQLNYAATRAELIHHPDAKKETSCKEYEETEDDTIIFIKINVLKFTLSSYQYQSLLYMISSLAFTIKYSKYLTAPSRPLERISEGGDPNKWLNHGFLCLLNDYRISHPIITTEDLVRRNSDRKTYMKLYKRKLNDPSSISILNLEEEKMLADIEKYYDYETIVYFRSLCVNELLAQQTSYFSKHKVMLRKLKPNFYRKFFAPSSSANNNNEMIDNSLKSRGAGLEISDDDARHTRQLIGFTASDDKRVDKEKRHNLLLNINQIRFELQDYDNHPFLLFLLEKPVFSAKLIGDSNSYNFSLEDSKILYYPSGMRATIKSYNISEKTPYQTPDDEFEGCHRLMTIYRKDKSSKNINTGLNHSDLDDAVTSSSNKSVVPCISMNFDVNPTFMPKDVSSNLEVKILATIFILSQSALDEISSFFAPSSWASSSYIKSMQRSQSKAIKSLIYSKFSHLFSASPSTKVQLKRPMVSFKLEAPVFIIPTDAGATSSFIFEMGSLMLESSRKCVSSDSQKKKSSSEDIDEDDEENPFNHSPEEELVYHYYHLHIIHTCIYSIASSSSHTPSLKRLATFSSAISSSSSLPTNLFYSPVNYYNYYHQRHHNYTLLPLSLSLHLASLQLHDSVTAIKPHNQFFVFIPSLSFNLASSSISFVTKLIDFFSSVSHPNISSSTTSETHSSRMVQDIDNDDEEIDISQQYAEKLENLPTAELSEEKLAARHLIFILLSSLIVKKVEIVIEDDLGILNDLDNRSSISTVPLLLIHFSYFKFVIQKRAYDLLISMLMQKILIEDLSDSSNSKYLLETNSPISNSNNAKKTFLSLRYYHVSNSDRDSQRWILSNYQKHFTTHSAQNSHAQIDEQTLKLYSSVHSMIIFDIAKDIIINIHPMNLYRIISFFMKLNIGWHYAGDEKQASLSDESNRAPVPKFSRRQSLQLLLEHEVEEKSSSINTPPKCLFHMDINSLHFKLITSSENSISPLANILFTSISTTLTSSSATDDDSSFFPFYFSSFDISLLLDDIIVGYHMIDEKGTVVKVLPILRLLSSSASANEGKKEDIPVFRSNEMSSSSTSSSLITFYFSNRKKQRHSHIILKLHISSIIFIILSRFMDELCSFFLEGPIGFLIKHFFMSRFFSRKREKQQLPISFLFSDDSDFDERDLKASEEDSFHSSLYLCNILLENIEIRCPVSYDTECRYLTSGLIARIPSLSLLGDDYSPTIDKHNHIQVFRLCSAVMQVHSYEVLSDINKMKRQMCITLGKMRRAKFRDEKNAKIKKMIELQKSKLPLPVSIQLMIKLENWTRLSLLDQLIITEADALRDNKMVLKKMIEYISLPEQDSSELAWWSQWFHAAREEREDERAENERQRLVKEDEETKLFHVGRLPHVLLEICNDVVNEEMKLFKTSSKGSPPLDLLIQHLASNDMLIHLSSFQQNPFISYRSEIKSNKHPLSFFTPSAATISEMEEKEKKILIGLSIIDDHKHISMKEDVMILIPKITFSLKNAAHNWEMNAEMNSSETNFIITHRQYMLLYDLFHLNLKKRKVIMQPLLDKWKQLQEVKSTHSQNNIEKPIISVLNTYFYSILASFISSLLTSSSNGYLTFSFRGMSICIQDEEMLMMLVLRINEIESYIQKNRNQLSIGFSITTLELEDTSPTVSIGESSMERHNQPHFNHILSIYHHLNHPAIKVIFNIDSPLPPHQFPVDLHCDVEISHIQMISHVNLLDLAHFFRLDHKHADLPNNFPDEKDVKNSGVAPLAIREPFSGKFLSRNDVSSHLYLRIRIKSSSFSILSSSLLPTTSAFVIAFQNIGVAFDHNLVHSLKTHYYSLDSHIIGLNIQESIVDDSSSSAIIRDIIKIIPRKAYTIIDDEDIEIDNDDYLLAPLHASIHFETKPSSLFRHEHDNKVLKKSKILIGHVQTSFVRLRISFSDIIMFFMTAVNLLPISIKKDFIKYFLDDHSITPVLPNVFSFLSSSFNIKPYFPEVRITCSFDGLSFLLLNDLFCTTEVPSSLPASSTNLSFPLASNFHPFLNLQLTEIVLLFNSFCSSYSFILNTQALINFYNLYQNSWQTLMEMITLQLRIVSSSSSICYFTVSNRMNINLSTTFISTFLEVVNIMIKRLRQIIKEELIQHRESFPSSKKLIEYPDSYFTLSNRLIDALSFHTSIGDSRKREMSYIIFNDSDLHFWFTFNDIKERVHSYSSKSLPFSPTHLHASMDLVIMISIGPYYTDHLLDLNKCSSLFFINFSLSSLGEEKEVSPMKLTVMKKFVQGHIELHFHSLFCLINHSSLSFELYPPIEIMQEIDDSFQIEDSQKSHSEKSLENLLQGSKEIKKKIIKSNKFIAPNEMLWLPFLSFSDSENKEKLPQFQLRPIDLFTDPSSEFQKFKYDRSSMLKLTKDLKKLIIEFPPAIEWSDIHPMTRSTFISLQRTEDDLSHSSLMNPLNENRIKEANDFEPAPSKLFSKTPSEIPDCIYFHLFSPIRVYNYLTIPLNIQLLQEQLLDPAYSCQTIKPSESQLFHHINMLSSSSSFLHLQILDGIHNNWSLIPLEVNFKALLSSEKLPLQMKLHHFHAPSGDNDIFFDVEINLIRSQSKGIASFDIILYSSYWIMNLTDFDLAFTETSSQKSNSPKDEIEGFTYHFKANANIEEPDIRDIHNFSFSSINFHSFKISIPSSSTSSLINLLNFANSGVIELKQETSSSVLSKKLPSRLVQLGYCLDFPTNLVLNSFKNLSLFHRTKILVFSPSIILSNKLEQSIEIRQFHSNSSNIIIPPKTAIPFQWPDFSVKEKMISFRIIYGMEAAAPPPTLWSGFFSPSEIGSFILMISSSDETNSEMQNFFRINTFPSTTSASTYCVISQTPASSYPFFIVNRLSSFSLRLSQHGLNRWKSLSTGYSTTLPSKLLKNYRNKEKNDTTAAQLLSCCFFAWEEPAMPHLLDIDIIDHPELMISNIDLDHLPVIKKLSVMRLCIFEDDLGDVDGITKIIHISTELPSILADTNAGLRITNPESANYPIYDESSLKEMSAEMAEQISRLNNEIYEEEKQLKSLSMNQIDSYNDSPSFIASVQIIEARNISYSSEPSIYAKLVFNNPDSKKQEHRTKYIPSLNPIWNENPQIFELNHSIPNFSSTLSVSVYHRNIIFADEFLAGTTICLEPYFEQITEHTNASDKDSCQVIDHWFKLHPPRDVVTSQCDIHLKLILALNLQSLLKKNISRLEDQTNLIHYKKRQIDSVLNTISSSNSLEVKRVLTRLSTTLASLSNDGTDVDELKLSEPEVRKVAPHIYSHSLYLRILDEDFVPVGSGECFFIIASIDHAKNLGYEHYLHSHNETYKIILHNKFSSSCTYHFLLPIHPKDVEYDDVLRLSFYHDISVITSSSSHTNFAEYFGYIDISLASLICIDYSSSFENTNDANLSKNFHIGKWMPIKSSRSDFQKSVGFIKLQLERHVSSVSTNSAITFKLPYIALTLIDDSLFVKPRDLLALSINELVYSTSISSSSQKETLLLIDHIQVDDLLNEIVVLSSSTSHETEIHQPDIQISSCRSLSDSRNIVSKYYYVGILFQEFNIIISDSFIYHILKWVDNIFSLISDFEILPFTQPDVRSLLSRSFHKHLFDSFVDDDLLYFSHFDIHPIKINVLFENSDRQAFMNTFEFLKSRYLFFPSLLFRFLPIGESSTSISLSSDSFMITNFFSSFHTLKSILYSFYFKNFFSHISRTFFGTSLDTKFVIDKLGSEFVTSFFEPYKGLVISPFEFYGKYKQVNIILLRHYLEACLATKGITYNLTDNYTYDDDLLHAYLREKGGFNFDLGTSSTHEILVNIRSLRISLFDRLFDTIQNPRFLHVFPFNTKFRVQNKNLQSLLSKIHQYGPVFFARFPHLFSFKGRFLFYHEEEALGQYLLKNFGERGEHFVKIFTLFHNSTLIVVSTKKLLFFSSISSNNDYNAKKSVFISTSGSLEMLSSEKGILLSSCLSSPHNNLPVFVSIDRKSIVMIENESAHLIIKSSDNKYPLITITCESEHEAKFIIPKLLLYKQRSFVIRADYGGPREGIFLQIPIDTVNDSRLLNELSLAECSYSNVLGQPARCLSHINTSHIIDPLSSKVKTINTNEIQRLTASGVIKKERNKKKFLFLELYRNSIESFVLPDDTPFTF